MGSENSNPDLMDRGILTRLIKKNGGLILKTLLLISLLIVLLVYPLLSIENVIARIIPIEGVIIISGNPDVVISKKTNILNNTRVKTGVNSNSKVIYNDGSTIRLVGESELTFMKNWIKMKKGNVKYTFKKKGKKFKITTSTILIGLLGTEFSVNVPNTSTSFVSLFEGSIEVQALFGKKNSVVLTSGQMINASKTGLSHVKTIQEKTIKFWEKVLGSKEIQPETDNEEFNHNQSIEYEEINELVCDEENGNILLLKLLCRDSDENGAWRATKVIAHIWIDDCNYYMGQKMIFCKGKIFGLIKNLARDIHNVSIFCGGYQHDFDLDLSDQSSNFHEEKIKYNLIKLGFRSKTTGKTLNPKEIVSDLEIILNDQVLKLKVSTPSVDWDPNYADIGYSSKRLNLFLPISERYFNITVKSKKFHEKVITIDLEEKNEWWDAILEERSEK